MEKTSLTYSIWYFFTRLFLSRVARPVGVDPDLDPDPKLEKKNNRIRVKDNIFDNFKLFFNRSHLCRVRGGRTPGPVLPPMPLTVSYPTDNAICYC